MQTNNVWNSPLVTIAIVVMPFVLLVGAIFLARKSGLIKAVHHDGEVIPQSGKEKAANAFLIIFCIPLLLWSLLALAWGASGFGVAGIIFVGLIMAMVTTKKRRNNVVSNLNGETVQPHAAATVEAAHPKPTSEDLPK